MATSNVQSRGMALMEVLVAGFLLTVGFMAVLQMQLTALWQLQETGLRQQASLLADELVEHMRVNPQGIAAANFLLLPADTVQDCWQHPGCSGEEFFRSALSSWLSQVESVLPDAQVDLQKISGTQGKATMILRLTWHASSLSQASDYQLEFIF